MKLLSVCRFVKHYISSKLGRKEKLNWFEKKLCCLLSKLEYNHCYKSLGE